MSATVSQSVVFKRGAPDSGRYFRYMAQFVGLTPEDEAIIGETKPLIEKHLPEIVAKFYAHLLRYPPTRRFFLKKDGSIDQEYLELRMRHLTNFWLRTASGGYDDTYASFVDYVGRAHTSHGADPSIYIAERYVIGQVGFIQHAISEVITHELRHVDEDLETAAVEAWDKLMMVILEMLSRAYGNERETEKFDALVSEDVTFVKRLATEAFVLEHDKDKPLPVKSMTVARVEDIPEGERKIVQSDGVSIGIFHHNGNWYAMRNSCLHRGGPVCTGALDGDTLTCPWHGFQYNVTTGQLLVDPNAKLDTYTVDIENGEIKLELPDFAALGMATASAPASPTPPPPPATSEAVSESSNAPALQPNEFRVGEVSPGQLKLLDLNGHAVTVYNVGGTFFATQDECTHNQNPLSDGDLDGEVVTCFYHGSQFNVRDGKVVRGPATKPLKLYRVAITGDIGRVEEMPGG